jgi:hypothetical protein
MKIFPLLLLLIFFASCTRNHRQPTADEKAVNAIQKKVALELLKTHDLYPLGTGSGNSEGNLRMLALSFSYYQPVNIEQGRELLIATVNALVSSVNNDEPVRSHLRHFPFQTKNVEIRIFLKDSNSSSTTAGQLSVLSAIDDRFEYDIRDPETARLKRIFKETYEEALLAMQRSPHISINTRQPIDL